VLYQWAKLQVPAWVAAEMKNDCSLCTLSQTDAEQPCPIHELTVETSKPLYREFQNGEVLSADRLNEAFKQVLKDARKTRMFRRY
jgi:hypothetical protein